MEKALKKFLIGLASIFTLIGAVVPTSSLVSAEESDDIKFPMTVEHDSEPIEGGTDGNVVQVAIMVEEGITALNNLSAHH